ncbi:hypothetical protein HYFRA_00011889 [Hymenoscyphus fraxineus]|uniref:Wax synthase domain-containing protein n=1 Tax=Hymenoscyphus fraxineus TaxID=746836 RepID=A0A9N9PJQ9_9HELO|nr:hypothetical protein HYFRA_00011889 [Hymenoscyphus fraxineus]
MNVSEIQSGMISLSDLQVPPEINKIGEEVIKAIAFTLIPVELAYFSIYFHTKGVSRLFKILTFLSLVTCWISLVLAPISCGPARCLQHLAIAIGTMKLLDIWARQDSLPTYTAGSKPPDWKLALMLLTELRYESFTPNSIRVLRKQENFNEPLQLALHTLAFAFLQSLPQNHSTILAFEVLLAIYIIWTCMQMALRYKSSPALFGPLYLADSLTGFWSETWHNAFASPCTSLIYAPIRHGLPKLGFPIVLARSLGVIGAFGLMALFHVFAFSPILSNEALKRIAIFFLLNGVATVAEAMVWGRRKHWMKAGLAWGFETALASWTASGVDIPNGLGKIDWVGACRSRS